MGFNQVTSLMIVLTAAWAACLAGCVSTQKTDADPRPLGVPEAATAVGGGIEIVFTPPADGLLYVVDADDNRLVKTVQVEGGEKVELDASEIMEAVWFARLGPAIQEDDLRRKLMSDEGGIQPTTVVAYYAPLSRLDMGVEADGE